MITIMNKELKEVLAGLTTPKFLATADSSGQPNIVPVISIEAWDEKTLIFGELMIKKTKSNLKEGAPVCVGVMTEDGTSWSIKGTFTGFERTGARYDKVSNNEMFRYNAYSGVRSAGIINVDEVSPRKKPVIAAVAAGIGIVMLRRGVGGVVLKGEGPVPKNVAEKFARLKAAKFLSWLDASGYPTAASCITLFPVGYEQLAVSEKELGAEPPEPGSRIAAAIITFDPIAYQVKGTLAKYRDYFGTKIARINIDEVYSASPPLPGHRIA